MLNSIREWFGFGTQKPEPMRGIVGVTEDGCYLVDNGDGKIVKSHPLQPAIGDGWTDEQREAMSRALRTGG